MLVGAHPDDESFGAGAVLAQYVLSGVKVYYVCCTRGEAGDVAPKFLEGYKSIAELRTHELETAAKALGLSGVIYLGYRDSGMIGSPENKNPNAFMNAPVADAAGKVVAILRKLKPQVVITSDPAGGYHHPDHIAAHKAAKAAFYAAGDPKQYPDAGPVYQPQKLYYNVFPHGLLRWNVRIWKMLGRDVKHFGKNGDINLEAMAADEFPVHAVVKLSKEANLRRQKASESHASQYGGPPIRRRGIIMMLINRILGPRDSFMRDYPPPKGRKKEHDLFENVKLD
jgi:N-acetyl-1-D-myo-inositol-2-amino-2-deoxy-alpha-D-glucopyranoside deacetylase/mycothiol S-conjugate amidase